MKRIAATVMALGLVVGACGSSDDDSAADEPAAAEDTEEAPPADEPEAEEPADAADTDTADTDTDDTDAGDTGMDTGDDDMDDDGDDDGNDSTGGGSIRSIDDVPEECREEMANFLRDIEPIVSSIDWQTATLADFESIAADFEAKSSEFEAASASVNCDDLEFEDDSEFDLLIDFARDEAPGTVSFLEFIGGMRTALPSDDGSGGDSSADGAFETCEDGIAFVQNMIDNYDSFTDVPAGELLQFANISQVLATCTPEQAEFFDSDEVNDFLSG